MKHVAERNAFHSKSSGSFILKKGGMGNFISEIVAISNCFLRKTAARVVAFRPSSPEREV